MIREMVGPAEARNGLSQAERRPPPHSHHVHPLSILFILSELGREADQYRICISAGSPGLRETSPWMDLRYARTKTSFLPRKPSGPPE